MDAGYRQDALSLLIWRIRSYVPCLWLQPVRNLNDFNRLSKSGQIVEEFLLDALGSAIAEATVREACKAMEKEFGAKGLGISYPYSPGYCGWKVSDQQILFSLLPNQPCGVSLTASSLMCPIKSVSGVVGIGRQMTRQKYGCELCGKKDCYKNRLNK